MQSLYERIFGTTAQNAAINSYASSRSIANSQQSQYAQNQLANGYNQALMAQYQMYRNKPKWVYNGVDCDVNEFAELMWPDDEQARLMFILKHGGV